MGAAALDELGAWEGRRRAPLPPRLLGAALLGVTGGLHLALYYHGYGAVHVIGLLFLAQVAACFALGAALVVVPHRAVAGAGALLALGTLGGYLLTLFVGLFGFKEVRTGPGAWAGGTEVAAFAVLAPLAAGLLGPRWRRAALGPLMGVAAGAAAVLAVGLVVEPPGASTGGGGKPLVEAVTVPGFGRVVGTSRGDSLYLLSDEAGGRLACTGACLSIWPPLLAGARAQSLVAGPGVAGQLGRLRRGAQDQLTYNGYPLYLYAGDPGPSASAGEGVVSNGGTWYLVRASARSPGRTAVTHRVP
jgi:predicted lipoprotein with Yx(FWY)xxD motif